MIFYIAIPENQLTDKQVYEARMSAIHQLESEGHSVRYTMFDSTWWSADSLKQRGVKHNKLHFFAKMLEEVSKCDGIYFLSNWQDDVMCKHIYEAAVLMDDIIIRYQES